MVARAEAAAATEERIRSAALALFMARDYSDVTLEDIAARAKVAMPTVLRRFGSKARRRFEPPPAGFMGSDGKPGSDRRT